MRCARERCHSTSFFVEHHFVLFILRGLRFRVHAVFSAEFRWIPSPYLFEHGKAGHLSHPETKQPPDNDSDLCWFLRVVLISLVTLAGGRNLDRVFATSLDNRVPTVPMFLGGAHPFKCLRG